MLEYTAHSDVARGFARARAERAQTFQLALKWMFKRRRRGLGVAKVSRWA